MLNTAKQAIVTVTEEKISTNIGHPVSFGRSFFVL